MFLRTPELQAGRVGKTYPWVSQCVTEALMLVRPFRLVAPVLAALGLIGLRLLSPIIGPTTPPSSGAVEDGVVVFRHYL
jgi:hypothetical protein